MKKKNDWLKKLEWYVLWHEFNDNKIEMFNIFCNSKLCDSLPKLMENYVSFEDFKRQLKSILMWCYWSKAEYEILASGLFHRSEDDVYKIDIWFQLEPNIDTLARYIIDKYNERPYARKDIDINAKN